MNIQEKFLIATKNAMFWNFSSHDITETLKDLKHNFQDARKNGSSDNEIINEYGSPKRKMRFQDKNRKMQSIAER